MHKKPKIGTVPIVGKLVPGTTCGYVVESKYVQGGYVVVKTLEERDELTSLDIYEHNHSIITGSLVYVSDEKKTYRYSTDTETWAEETAEVDLKEIEEEIDELRTSLESLSDDTTVKLAEVDLKLADLETKVNTEIDTAINEVKSELADLETSVDDKFTNVESRLDTTDASITTLDSKIDNVSTNVDAVSQEVDRVDSEVAEISKSLSDYATKTYVDNAIADIDLSKVIINSSNVIIDVEGETRVDFGLISAGTTIYGLTLSQLLTKALYGELYPTLLDPSMTVTVDSTFGIYDAAFSTTGTITFDRGSIDPAYGTSGYRSGLPTSYTIGAETTTSSDLTFNFTVSINALVAGENNIDVSVAYVEGEQPLSNIGASYDSPLPAGALEDVITITGVTSAYTGLTNSTDYTETPISTTTFVDETSTGGGAYYVCDVQATLNEYTASGDDATQSVCIPSSLTLYGIKIWDELTQQWQWLGGSAAESLSIFCDISTYTVTIDGVDVDYTVFSSNPDTEDYPVGERQFRLYISAPEEG